ncbi:tRNA U54 and U55 pseudouridine synthase Pus10 [Methanonatronarchaeum thermophilum]|uniref:tRNA pseudouridine synthase Pus10 n=1 Tax=Methanonatronarchaeum thermophilum TaxID=1927129 RepID=A0A1Y3GDP7_9EURY|nr:tRNA pseudouridine(54/55) synthase Pus10 [Methanonatronarchaeum thermophilum]OUJ19380.1 tRNA U54 and U55 pseudouridine synthase Pus10 [Methanonatronarchaeum thermophilum]
MKNNKQTEKLSRPAKKALQILTDKNLCNHCLGRQYGLLLSGTDNKTRGQILRNYLLMHGDLTLMEDENPTILEKTSLNSNLSKKTLERRGLNHKPKKQKCWLCNNLFDDLDTTVDQILEKTSDIEFNTFLVGTKLTPELIQKEETIWAEYGADYAESLKSEINREIGKKFEQKVDAEVEFKTPDIVAIIHLKDNTIEINNNPIFIYGRYRKHVRGIPQTEWYCPVCRGEGCMRCDGEGSLYEKSIEKTIAKPILKQTKGTEAIFHGAGREDVDVKMLGNGRPFVMEIKNPKKREINHKEIMETINQKHGDKIEVKKIQPTNRNKIKEIKEARAPKSYRAKINAKPKGNKITKQQLKKALKQLEGQTIEQETPRRISRRPEKTRKRKILETELLEQTNEHYIIKIKTEAGAYVKEIISGDKGKTTPSLAELLKKDIKCLELDVINVHYKN